MMSSKHEGDILPRSVTKKKGNWVIKLSNESNAILRTPIEFTAGSNLIKCVCSHGGSCRFSLRRQSQTVSLVISWYSSTYLLPIYQYRSIYPFIHLYTGSLPMCVCVCVCILGYDWLHYTAGSLDTIVHKQIRLPHQHMEPSFQRI